MNGIEEVARAQETKLKQRALAALEKSNLSEVCEICGIDGNFESAGAALKTALAEHAAAHIARAARLAKEKGLKFGAAAIVLSAQK